MTRKTAINIILILLAAILGVVAYKLSPLLRATGDTVLPVSTCNPSAQACQVSLPNGGKVELSFAPRPIRPLQAFKAEMSVHDVKVSKAEIDFEGTAMKMGYYRPEFKGADGIYAADAILPVCVTGTMEWAATVVLTTAVGTIAIPFHFEVAGR